MARWREDLVYRPDLRARKEYEKIYPLYRALAEKDGSLASAMRVMRRLREL